MISISYVAMGILIAVVNGLLFMVIALFLMYYLKSQKEVSTVQKLADKISERETKRIEEITTLLKKFLAQDSEQSEDIAKAIRLNENEVYTAISETYINRDNKALLDLDCKIETLFKLYIEAVESHINTNNNEQVESAGLKKSINIIFQKYMAATGETLDEGQEYTFEQMLELVEQYNIQPPKQVDLDHAASLNVVKSNDMSHEDLISEYEQLKTRYFVVIEELKMVFVEYAALFQLDAPESGVWDYEDISKHLKVDTSRFVSEESKKTESTSVPEPIEVKDLVSEEMNQDTPKDKNSSQIDVQNIDDISGLNSGSELGAKPDDNHEEVN